MPAVPGRAVRRDRRWPPSTLTTAVGASLTLRSGTSMSQEQGSLHALRSLGKEDSLPGAVGPACGRRADAAGYGHAADLGRRRSAGAIPARWFDHAPDLPPDRSRLRPARTAGLLARDATAAAGTAVVPVTPDLQPDRPWLRPAEPSGDLGPAGALAHPADRSGRPASGDLARTRIPRAPDRPGWSSSWDLAWPGLSRTPDRPWRPASGDLAWTRISCAPDRSRWSPARDLAWPGLPGAPDRTRRASSGDLAGTGLSIPSDRPGRATAGDLAGTWLPGTPDRSWRASSWDLAWSWLSRASDRSWRASSGDLAGTGLSGPSDSPWRASSGDLAPATGRRRRTGSIAPDLLPVDRLSAAGEHPAADRRADDPA
jgi:hypothetical protein